MAASRLSLNIPEEVLAAAEVAAALPEWRWPRRLSRSSANRPEASSREAPRQSAAIDLELALLLLLELLVELLGLMLEMVGRSAHQRWELPELAVVSPFSSSRQRKWPMGRSSAWYPARQMIRLLA